MQTLPQVNEWRTRTEMLSVLKDIWDAQDWLILDTETTGLDESAEIVEIALIGSNGQTVYSSLVKPQCGHIPDTVTAVHGICDTDVEHAPTFDTIWPELQTLLTTKRILIYNAEFDVRLLHQTGRLYDITVPLFQTRCLMKAYTLYTTDNRFARFISLTKACKQQGIQEPQQHRAVGDCVMTHALFAKMVGATE